MSYSAGIEHFHLLTSTGSNSKSPFLYPATKGKVEEFCEALTFPKLTIYQPGLLLCPREESRMGEFVFQKVRYLYFIIYRDCPKISCPKCILRVFKSKYLFFIKTLFIEYMCYFH